MRGRARLRGLLAAVLAALAAGLVVLALGRLAQYVTALPVSAEILAGSAAAIVLVVGLIVAALRLPRLDAVARGLDAELELDERVSSALEVSEDWPRDDNVVAAALLRDVEARAEGFDPRRLVPLHTRGLVATAIAALVAGAAALLVPAAANVPADGPVIEEAAPAETASHDGKIDDSEIRQLAELLREDSEKRRNEFLAAIANSMEKLAEDAAAGRPESEIDEQLRQLMDMAKQAYGKSLPDWMPPDTSDLADLDRRLQEKADQPALPSMVGVSYENPYEMGYYGLPSDWKGPVGRDKTFDEMAREGAQQGEGMDAKVDPNAEGGGDTGISPNLPFEAKPLEEAAEVTAAPAGAAADSSKGDAQMAGGGEEAISSADLAAAEYAASADMSIRTDRPEAEGKRIRLELPPDAESTEAGDSDLGSGSRGRAEADSVSRSLVDAQARAVIARYFAREQG